MPSSLRFSHGVYTRTCRLLISACLLIGRIMTSNCLRYLRIKMVGAVTLSLFVAACSANSVSGISGTETPTLASSTIGSGTAVPTATTKCSVTPTDLLPTGGSVSTTAPTVTINGSKTAVGAGSSQLSNLMKDIIAAFNAGNPGANVSYTAVGQAAALQELLSGAAQFIGTDAFVGDVSPSYSGQFTDHQIAVTSYTLVVSSDLQGKITNLTTKQIHDIFAGVITNWNAINPMVSEPITIANRQPGTGESITFDEYAWNIADWGTYVPPTDTFTATSNDALVNKLTTTNGAIGYVSTHFFTVPDLAKGLNPLCIDGYAPTPTNVYAGAYKFWNYEHIYTLGTTEVAADSIMGAFLAYVEPIYVRNTLTAEGFLQINNLTPAAKATHPIPANG